MGSSDGAIVGEVGFKVGELVAKSTFRFEFGTPGCLSTEAIPGERSTVEADWISNWDVDLPVTCERMIVSEATSASSIASFVRLSGLEPKSGDGIASATYVQVEAISGW